MSKIQLIPFCQSPVIRKTRSTCCSVEIRNIRKRDKANNLNSGEVLDIEEGKKVIVFSTMPPKPSNSRSSVPERYSYKYRLFFPKGGKLHGPCLYLDPQDMVDGDIQNDLEDQFRSQRSRNTVGIMFFSLLSILIGISAALSWDDQRIVAFASIILVLLVLAIFVNIICLCRKIKKKDAYDINRIDTEYILTLSEKG